MAASSSSPKLQPDEEPDNNNDALKDWNLKDKFRLLFALKTCETDNIQQIKDFFPDKTVAEVKIAVDYFGEIAMQHPIFNNESPSRTPEPLRKYLRTETAPAVRMIAGLQKVQPKELVENIDYRDVYLQLANILEGKPVTPHPLTMPFITKWITESALKSEEIKTREDFEKILNKVRLLPSEIGTQVTCEPDLPTGST